MGKYVGLDWASNGWFGVVFTDGSWETDLFPSILSVWKRHSDADRILVDVPIGLPTDGRRQCDVEAKRRLGDRHRSVFYTPVRDAVYGQRFTGSESPSPNRLVAAKRRNETAGFGIQNQAWSIVPRIREVDEFLDVYPTAVDRIRETHPEVCFRAFAREGLAPKHTVEGIEDRRTALAAESDLAGEVIDSAIAQYAEPSYAPCAGRTDVLDALAAAVTARRSDEQLSTLPSAGEPPRDERGLRMEIVYPDDTKQVRLGEALG